MSTSSVRVARLDKHELSAIPAHWNRQQRGHFLRGLLRARGIDPNRLYQLSYYPHHACWLFTQIAPEPAEFSPRAPAVESDKADELFFTQVSTELRRTALAARGNPYAVRGAMKYQLPVPGQEMTPTALRDLLGSSGSEGPTIRFDGEGGWQLEN